ncbi:MAG: AMP-binding protein, partial [Planctomycetota bacterium]
MGGRAVPPSRLPGPADRLHRYRGRDWVCQSVTDFVFSCGRLLLRPAVGGRRPLRGRGWVHATPAFFRELLGLGRELPGLEVVPLGGEALVPIGRVTAGSTVCVLDRGGRPSPVGVHGELWIGGEGVARGYLGRAALTAEHFRPDEDGGRVYRTGDLTPSRECPGRNFRRQCTVKSANPLADRAGWNKMTVAGVMAGVIADDEPDETRIQCPRAGGGPHQGADRPRSGN